MKMKKQLSLALALAVITTAAAGCAANSSAAESSSKAGDSSSAAATKEYNGNDVSKHVDLTMYVIGDKQPDEEKVLAEINKKLEETVNASLTFKNISLSDYETRYSLLISSGEKFDMIYTSTWAFYSQEATKGAFAEVTDDALTKYMPMHKENEPQDAFDQAKIDGKVYFVPCNLANVQSNAMLIRGDLREKYNLPEIKTIEDLEAYYDAVAKGEDGIFPYAASQNNLQMKMVIYNGLNDFVQVPGLINYFQYGYKADLKGSDVTWMYDTPEYLEWANKMADWSAKGYWSKNAVANTTDPKDAFENGTSASFYQNLGTCGVVANNIVSKHPEWKPELYDLAPDSVKIKGAYIGDGVAVMAASENQERAFMALDIIKFDEDCYNLLRLGIKGTHWNEEADMQWSAAADNAKYAFGNASSWGFKNTLYERTRSDMFPTQKTMGQLWTKNAKVSPTAGLSFNDASVKNQLANISNLWAKYGALLDLGLSGDVEGTLKEFNEQANSAGLEAVLSELQKQVDEYIAAH